MKKKLPSGWKSVKLGDIFAERTETNCDDLDLLSVTIKRGIIPRTEIKGKGNSNVDKSKYLKVCKGDIAYNTMRMWQGVSSLSKYEGVVSPAYTVLESCDSICAGYFAYLFKLRRTIFQFYQISQGIVDDTRTLKYKDFASIRALIPPLAEQRVIAEILTTADKLIDVKERLVAAKKKQKRWLMQNLLTGKKWKTVKFSSLFNRLNRRNNVGDTNVLTISAWHGLVNQEQFFNKSVASENLSDYYLLYKGDFAYNKSYSGNYKFGAFKRLIKYDSGVVSPLYICFAPTADNLCPDFYAHYFESTMLDKELNAIAQEGARNHGLLNIPVNDFFAMPIPLPPLPEQQAIASVLTTADRELELLSKELEQHKLIKKHLMQQLLTGKIRVNNLIHQGERGKTDDDK